MNSPSLPRLSRVNSSSATLSEEIYSTFFQLSLPLKSEEPRRRLLRKSGFTV